MASTRSTRDAPVGAGPLGAAAETIDVAVRDVLARDLAGPGALDLARRHARAVDGAAGAHAHGAGARLTTGVVTVLVAERGTRRHVVALDDAVVAARGRTLRHAVTEEATVVAAHAATTVEVVAVLIAAVAVAAEEALVTTAALAVFTGLALVVVTTQRRTGDQHGEERYEPSHRFRSIAERARTGTVSSAARSFPCGFRERPGVPPSNTR
jgi:hypothetical protein